ncbi:MAG TPA: hypothetical protein VMI34_02115 [Candidatus Bathyarchaeia archaeon]|nr:hypothetical protein [Candidatus Bathyarchaeia archaeon]
MKGISRRRVLMGGTAAALVLARARVVGTQAPPATAGPADPKLIEDLVAANRILVDQGVVDGYGHVSVRHDKAADRYLMSRSIAPELVTAADIMTTSTAFRWRPAGGPCISSASSTARSIACARTCAPSSTITRPR